MKVLDIFSGIGGFSLGLERAGMETIAFCEIEEYPQKVLAKHWPGVPIASDVKELNYKNGALYDGQREIYRGAIDLVCGGFPCQDISISGKQEGIGEGTRSGLWSECARLLREVQPEYAIFENVTALLSGNSGEWFQRVLWDISKVGYDAEWHCIRASDVGANHRRDRVWIIAYPKKLQRDGCKNNTREFMERGKVSKLGNSCGEADLSNANSERCKERNIPIFAKEAVQLNRKYYESLSDTDSLPRNGNEPNTMDGGLEAQGLFGNRSGVFGKSTWWETEPDVGRVAYGVPDVTHRLKGLGNAVVPQIPELIGKVIMEAYNESSI